MTRTRIITIEATYVGGIVSEVSKKVAEEAAKIDFCGRCGNAKDRPDDLHIKIQDFEVEPEGTTPC